MHCKLIRNVYIRTYELYRIKYTLCSVSFMYLLCTYVRTCAYQCIYVYVRTYYAYVLTEYSTYTLSHIRTYDIVRIFHPTTLTVG